MADTTSILDLPTDPTSGGGNITLIASEKNIPQQQGGLTLDQNTISQIVTGLQQASATGATQLPSRDIPKETNSITQDAQIQPNYIPQQSNVDYIKDYEDNEDIIRQYNKNAKYDNSLDELYGEIQTPLLLGVLFFLFQLPIFKKYLYSYFPILFLKDGNMNLNGYLFMSAVFGILYYLLNKVIIHFSKF